ncbi:hypothetical protein J2S49_000858 [Arcanobacterium wilhelmae]|uniref:Uncharacterized protein n=1 Tax=Arcanobacterium wilhelmae TaxID=1803177 RepID=A0ABT9NAN5_9ACTO|nr:hypothetical protein [Arcanobacterium wilhelmae]
MGEHNHNTGVGGLNYRAEKKQIGGTPGNARRAGSKAPGPPIAIAEVTTLSKN